MKVLLHLEKSHLSSTNVVSNKLMIGKFNKRINWYPPFQVIVIIFILCSTQALLAFIFDAIYVNTSPSWVQTYFAIVNVLVILNSATNFFIFYVFGKKFRVLSKRVLQCQMHHPNNNNGTIYRWGWRKRPL